MQTLKITDLEQSHELSAEEQAAKAGGTFAMPGGNLSAIENGPVTAVGGLFASPAVAVGPTNVVTQNDNDVNVNVDTTSLTNVLQGSIAQIAQGVGGGFKM